MPQLIAGLILAAIGISATATAFTIAGIAITYGALTAFIVGAVIAAAFVGLGLLLMPQPSTQDGQLNLNQAVPYRRRVYGRAKMGGFFAFLDSSKGTLYSLLMIASHQVDAFEEHWLGDRRVTVDLSNNKVTLVTFPPNANPHQFGDNGNIVSIYFQDGGPTKTSYSVLQTAWPGLWGTDHIGRGIADALLVQRGVKQNEFSTVYPGGAQPYRCVIRGARLSDPRFITSPPTTFWTDNAIAIIIDYLTHADGWRIDSQFFLTGTGVAISQASAAICEENVTLADGGSELRYRIWGYYDFSEEPRQVLARFLAAAGAWLEPQPDGTIGVRAGAWVDPDVTLTDDCILGYEVQRWPGEFDAINEVRASFVDQLNDYQQTETTPWDDDADIERRGYTKSITLDLRHCPSFTQARRVQKIGMAEVNPEWTINLVTNTYGLSARNRRFINLVIAELGLNITCRVTSFVANVQTGVCNIGLASFGSDAYDWDPDSEEGPPPPIPQDTSSTNAVEEPINFVATVEASVSGGVVQGSYIVLTCDQATDRADLDARFELSSNGGATWTTVPAGTDSLEAITAILPFGTYNARVSFIAPSKVQSVFNEIDGIVVSPDTTAPPEPNGLIATPVGSPPSQILLRAVAPNSPNFSYLLFWRSGSNVFSTASPISGPIYGSPNQSLTYTDSPGAGTWFYWATAVNAASPPAQSTPEGPVSATL